MTALLRKCFSGLGGAGVLIVSLYFSYNVARGMYYDYLLFPKLKAEDHYIAPTRWQDFAFLAIFWTTILLLLFAAFRLLRFALKRRSSD
jgi:hypothetical protein